MIDVSKHWPEFLKEFEELQEIARIENEQLEKQAQEINLLGLASFVQNADVKYLPLFEQWWRITVPTNATEEDRRVAIITEMNKRMPYTKRLLKRFLDGLVGADGYVMDIVYAERRLNLLIELKRINQVEAVRKMLREVLPANMLYDIQIRYNQLYLFKKFTLGELKQYTLGQLLRDPNIRQIYVERGGELI